MLRQKREEQVLIENRRDKIITKITIDAEKMVLRVKRDYGKDPKLRDEVIRSVELKAHKEINKVKDSFKQELRSIRRNHISTEEIQQQVCKTIARLEGDIEEKKLEIEKMKEEQAEYYLDILKNGIDCRREGLSWIVKRLIELNFPLNYKMFPHFLNTEQADFIIKV